MSVQVIQNAMCTCSFGTAPAALKVPPGNCVTAVSQPTATIKDHIPFVNVQPFLLCKSLKNPAVATATKKAQGVLTPMPCKPVLPTPWVAGSPTVLIKGKPALNQRSTLKCDYGGVIKVTSAGQGTVMIP